MHFLGEKYNLGLNFQKGDIQYVNNLGVFHARDAFTDQTGKEYENCVPTMYLRG
jgi:alpha-ketoglutarate-dependent taurine dioxygenase